MAILFVKEKEGNTVNDVLCRILSYLEQYVKKYNSMPDFVKLSKKDLKKIEEYNKTIINEENKILGMKVITYGYRDNKNYRRNHYGKRKFSRV